MRFCAEEIIRRGALSGGFDVVTEIKFNKGHCAISIASQLLIPRLTSVYWSEPLAVQFFRDMHTTASHCTGNLFVLNIFPFSRRGTFCIHSKFWKPRIIVDRGARTMISHFEKQRGFYSCTDEERIRCNTQFHGWIYALLTWSKATSLAFVNRSNGPLP